jgi:hypothetical protein
MRDPRREQAPAHRRDHQREDPRDLRTQLVEAFQSADSAVAWYLDRDRRRVVWVQGSKVSDETLTAKQVDEDEERFLEIPPVFESDVHDWMTEFVEEHGDPKVAGCLDHKAGANARFLVRLEKRDPAALTAWRKFRHAKLGTAVDAWLADVEAGKYDVREPIGGDVIGDGSEEE